MSTTFPPIKGTFRTARWITSIRCAPEVQTTSRICGISLSTTNGKARNFGYHEKDALEIYVCKQIVAGNLDPKEAYRLITTDWVTYYLELHLDKSSDGEDEAIN